MKKARVLVSKIRPGFVIAEDVYNAADQLVLPKGTVLSDRSITMLKFYSVNEVIIDITPPEGTGKNTSDNLKNVSTYIKQVKSGEDYKRFARSYKMTLDYFESNLTNFARGEQNLNREALLQNITDVYNTVRSTGKILDMLMCIRKLDDQTFVHSVNVALICNVFAQWLGYPQKEADELVMAGLLHDIGKLTVSNDILKKKGALTAEEFDVIKGHPLAGYRMLKDAGVDDKICRAALLHHERTDGTGYPFGYDGSHITDYARIVAIADVYDAMTAARCYRPPICPLEVLNLFETEGLNKYDPKYLLTFMDHIINSYLRQYVLLSNGAVGEIVMVNKHAPARPIIKLVDSTCIDLSKNRELSIVDIV